MLNALGEKVMLRFIKEFKKHSFLLEYLITRDFKVKYRRSVLGVAWSILNPLFMMLVVSAVFSIIIRVNIEPYSYLVYVILGQTMFNFLSESTNTAMQSILASSALIKKVYIPKYIFPLQKVTFSFVNFLISMVAVIIVGVIEGIGVSWHIALVPLLFILFYFFCLGLGLLLSCFTVFFRDTLHIYGILLTAWTYFTPIFYTLDSLGMYKSEDALWWQVIAVKIFEYNPMYQYINMFRNIVLFHTTPSLKETLLCIIYAVISLALGALVFTKKQDKFILHI